MASQVVSSPINLATIVLLTGNNYKRWRAEIDLYLASLDIDHCLTKNAPNPLTDESTDQERNAYQEWARANRMCKLIAMRTMSDTVKGSIPATELASEYFASIAERFTVSEKAQATMLLDTLTSMKYDMSQNIREYIMKMIDVSAQLAALDMPLDDLVLVHMALKSLPPQFDHLTTTYNTQKDKWSLNELIAVCVQEDERIRNSKSVSVNLVTKPQWKKGNFGKAGGVSKNPYHVQKKPMAVKGKKHVFKCFFCKREGHMKKQCEAYKNWKAKRGVPKQEGAKEK